MCWGKTEGKDGSKRGNQGKMRLTVEVRVWMRVRVRVMRVKEE